MTEQTFWAKLKKIGWLDFIPSSRLAEIREVVKKTFKSDPEMAYMALNQSGFDTECIDGAESYCELLKMFAKDSSGLFKPTQIEASYVKKGRKESIQVSLRHNRKLFSCVVPFESDWFDGDVLNLVNQALEAAGREEQFIELPVEDQCAFLVLVPPRVFEAAMKEGLIPDCDCC